MVLEGTNLTVCVSFNGPATLLDRDVAISFAIEATSAGGMNLIYYS